MPGHGHKGIATIHLAHHDASVTQVAIKRVNLEQWDQEFTYIQVSVFGSIMGTWSNGTPAYRSVCMLVLWVPGAMGHLHTGQFVC